MPDTFTVRYARDVADGLKTEAHSAVDYAARTVRALRAAGASEASIGTVIGSLTDAFGDVEKAIARALDSGGLLTEGAAKIDLSEIA